MFGLESEGENILVKVLPFAEARAMLERDEIDNAIGVIALQWLALHRDEVRPAGASTMLAPCQHSAVIDQRGLAHGVRPALCAAVQHPCPSFA